MSKFSIRCATIDFEFEGSEEFIKNGLLDLISDALELVKISPLPAGKNAVSRSGQALDFSVKTISAKLGNSSGLDLARSAASYLTLVEHRETFAQAELLSAMKSATGIYKQSTHGKNIGKIISSLLSNGTLLQTASGTYSLAEDQREQISKALNG